MRQTEGRVSNETIIPHLHFHTCLFRVVLQSIPAWFDSSAPQRHPSPAARLHFQVPQRNLPLHPNIVEEGEGGGSSRWEATGPRAKQTYLLLSHRFFWSLRRSPSSLFSCLSAAQRFIRSAVNSSSQRATLGSSGWELLKSPVIADQGKARYSPETVVVAVATPTVVGTKRGTHEGKASG